MGNDLLSMMERITRTPGETPFLMLTLHPAIR